MDINTFLQSDTFQYLLRIFFACVLGCIVGYGRNKKGSPAGIKTHSLVCVGAALIVVTSEFYYKIYGSGDVTRMAAQVVSGIGFLGAGTIIVTGKNRIKGLTTAAGIWYCACVGIAVGSGFYGGAILATILEILIPKLFKLHGSGPTMELLICYDENFSFIQFVRELEELKVRIINIGNGAKETIHINDNYLIITVEIRNDFKEERLFERAYSTKGILDIIEL